MGHLRVSKGNSRERSPFHFLNHALARELPGHAQRFFHVQSPCWLLLPCLGVDHHSRLVFFLHWLLLQKHQPHPLTKKLWTFGAQYGILIYVTEQPPSWLFFLYPQELNDPQFPQEERIVEVFQGAGQTLDTFSDLMYVRCPRCDRQAQVMRIVLAEDKQSPASSSSERYQLTFRPRKLSCLDCGLTKIWDGHTLYKGGPRDWYFCLPLWLQTPCWGELLWALNRFFRTLYHHQTALQIPYPRTGQKWNNG